MSNVLTAFSLAGFQVTTIGRFWVTAEAMGPADKKRLLIEKIKSILTKKKNAQKLFSFLATREQESSARWGELDLLKEVFPNIFTKHEEKTQTPVTQADLVDGPSIVRKAAVELRGVLKRFEASKEGRRLPISVTFPDGEYRLEFAVRDECVKKFWDPYLSVNPERQLLLVYTENVFFRSLKERYFIRHLDLNEATDDPGSKCKFIPEFDLPLQPARQFVSSGDVSTLLFLTRWFERLGVATEHAVAHRSSHELFNGKNLVLVGNRRTFALIDTLMSKARFNFRIEDDRIVNIRPEAPDPPSDGVVDSSASVFYRDDFGAPGMVRGLLFRTFDQDLGSWITIIASNSGRFHEAVAAYLTTDHNVNEFLNWLGVEKSIPIPDRFEALLKVGISKYEDNSRYNYVVEPLAKRVHSHKLDY